MFLIIQILRLQQSVQHAAEEQDTHTAVDPQQTNGHHVHGAVDVGVALEHVLHIEAEHVGEALPAHRRHHGTGQAPQEAVVLVGQDHIDQGEDDDLDHQQPDAAPVDQIHKKLHQRMPDGPELLRQGLAEDREHQRHDDQDQKYEGVAHGDQPGVEPAAVLLDAVDVVQARQQAVDAQTGGPQRRDGRDAQHRAGGVVVRADDQALRRPHQGAGQDALEKPDQIRGRQGRVAQRRQDQQQPGKQRDGQEVAGVGRVHRDLHGGDIEYQIFQPFHPFFPHNTASFPSG